MLQNISAICSLTVMDSIMRTAIIAVINAAVMNAFFIFFYLLFFIKS